MKHVCPELTTAEQQLLAKSRASFGGEPVNEQQLEQDLLDAVVKLLLKARYVPLTQQVGARVNLARNGCWLLYGCY
jgi:hypothetical protein